MDEGEEGMEVDQEEEVKEMPKTFVQRCQEVGRVGPNITKLDGTTAKG